LQAGNAELRDGTAAQLLAAGRGRPLFCLSGTQLYSDLATHLPTDTRVYGLLSKAEFDLLQHGSRLPAITDLAASYVKTVRRLQPRGPYRLAGFSIGGVIAFEVASQLRAMGEQVEMLALLDCAAPGFGLAHVVRWLQKRVLRLRQHGLGYLRRIRTELSAASSAKASAEGGSGSASVYPEYARVIRRYQAGRWEGPLLFLQSADDPIQEPGYGWMTHAPGLIVERIPGEHMDMVYGPAARLVAERLQHQFDKVCGRSPASTELRYSSTVELP